MICSKLSMVHAISIESQNKPIGFRERRWTVDRRLHNRHGGIHLPLLEALMYRHMSTKCRSSNTNRHHSNYSELTLEATKRTLEHLQRSIPVYRRSKLAVEVQLWSTRPGRRTLTPTGCSSCNWRRFYMLPGVFGRLRVAHASDAWGPSSPVSQAH